MTPTHVTELRVRYAEVDQMGVVHHPKYFLYLELARTEALRNLGVAYKDIESTGAYLVVAKASCRFLAPARYDDVIRIHTTVKRLTSARIDHSYEIRRKADNALVAEAETTLACVDREGNIRRIPEQIENLLHQASSSHG